MHYVKVVNEETQEVIERVLLTNGLLDVRTREEQATADMAGHLVAIGRLPVQLGSWRIIENRELQPGMPEGRKL